MKTGCGKYMKDRPDFTPMLLDTAFYASDPNYSTRDFVTGLVADTLQKGIGSADSQLSHFTNDLCKITDGLSQEAQKALWAQAMDSRFRPAPAPGRPVLHEGGVALVRGCAYCTSPGPS